MKRPYIVSVCLLLILVVSTAAFGQTIMIVNKDNPNSSATRQEVANLFLGKATQWKGGITAAVGDQKKTTAAGKAFLAKIVQMGESDFENLWVEKMLSGEAQPPKVLGSDSEVVDFVKSNVGAVGYISASSPHDGVKVLSIDGANEW